MNTYRTWIWTQLYMHNFNIPPPPFCGGGGRKLPYSLWTTGALTAYYWVVDENNNNNNIIDTTVIDKTSKPVRVIEMSCPWLENRESKDFEKTTKYSQLRLELTNRYPEKKVNQYHHGCPWGLFERG